MSRESRLNDLAFKQRGQEMRKIPVFGLVLVSLLLSSLSLPGASAASGGLLGPNLEDFPPGVSPLTGLPVSDPENLKLPAVLVSLSNFPPSVRPQTGLSFAPQVYEIYISEGMTRLLTVFYGELPRSYAAPTGDQPPGESGVQGDSDLLGNRVWLDENADGLQNPWEPGVGGVKVDLEQPSGGLIQSVVTDTNGYYAFQPEGSDPFRLRFWLPEGYKFSKPNAGADDSMDSDVLSDGRTSAIQFKGENLSVDAGLVRSVTAADGQSAGQSGTDSFIGAYEQPGDALAGVRSGREAYVPIMAAFPGGCLVAASKSAAVNVSICKNVYGRNSADINSAGLTVEQLKEIAEANVKPNRPVNYSGNVFASQPPEGGRDAGQLNVFYAWLNQSYWKYDPVSQAYLRFEDFANPDKVGQFRQSTDRLTGQPLAFENVVILFVEHTARTPTIIDLNMGPGTKGRAIVLRNGKIYENLIWTTMSENYERTTGLTRPIRLRYADGTPFPLAPGDTWFHVATTYSAVWQTGGEGVWKFRFYPPAGAK